MQKSMFIKMILILFVILFFNGCWYSSGGSTDLLLTEKDNGRTIEVNIKTKIIIELSSNPSTGYQWEPANLDDSFIKQDGESVYVVNDECKGLDGCGGKEQFIFRVIKTGNGRINLVYQRSPKENPVKKFQIDIKVR